MRLQKRVLRNLVWTLRQPSVRQLTRRCTTHDTLERGFEADRLTDARWVKGSETLEHAMPPARDTR
jgi:hypothetical protein